MLNAKCLIAVTAATTDGLYNFDYVLFIQRVTAEVTTWNKLLINFDSQSFID